MKVIFALSLLFLLLPIVQAQQITWGPDVRVSPDEQFGQIEPAVAIDAQGNVHIVWSQAIAFGTSTTELFYRKFDMLGRPLTQRIQITQKSPYEPGTSTRPSIVADAQGNLHIAWVDNRIPLYYTIFYKKLNNNGVNLTPEVVLYPTSGFGDPGLVTDPQGNVYIIFEGYEGRGIRNKVHFTKLNGNGQVLIPDTPLTNPPNNNSDESPEVARDQDGNLHIVWQTRRATGYLAVFYLKADSNGNVLISERRLISTNTSSNPTIASDANNNLHVVWSDGRDHNTWELYYKKLDANSQPLTGEIRLTNFTRSSFASGIAVDAQGNVNVAWEYDDSMYNSNIYYKKLDNNGNTLIDSANIANANGHGQLPKVVADTISPSSVHVVWPDDLLVRGKVYYKRSYPYVNLVMDSAVCFGNLAIFKIFSEQNANYILMMSLGTSPGIPLSDGRVIPLNPDPPFFLSITAPNILGLEGSIGTTNAQGQAQVRWRVPRDAPEGLTVYVSFITYNPSLPMPYTITSISPALPVR